MGMGGSPQEGTADARLGTALTGQAVIDAASRTYRAGQTLDMSALATELGIGRSTLYRLVGNREDLLGTVLAKATERTFQRAAAATTADRGADLVLDVMDRFMHAVINAQPLQALFEREPLVSVRLMLLPGPVEQTAARLISQMLETEVTAGQLELPLVPSVCGEAIVRMCDAHLYAPLLGRTEPGIDTALDLVKALLGRTRAPAR
jgi:AcrR family transcriptional regulator